MKSPRQKMDTCCWALFQGWQKHAKFMSIPKTDHNLSWKVPAVRRQQCYWMGKDLRGFLDLW